MTWFLVDDNFYDHPKVLGLSLKAIGLWTLAGSWSGRYLTEGRIPKSAIAKLGGTRSLAQQLVDAGLWHEEGDSWQFHGWDDINPTKADVLSKREKRSEAGRKGGLASGKSRQSKNGANAKANASQNVQAKHERLTNENEPNTNTNTYIKETTSNEVVKKNTKTLIPDSWTPTVAHRELAARKNIDIESEAAKFVDWAKANGRKYVDWDRAFSNWLRNAENFNRKPGYVNHAQEKLNAHLNMIAAAEAREQQPQLIEGSSNAFGF